MSVESQEKETVQVADTPVKKRRQRNKEFPNKAQVYRWEDWFRAGGVRARRGIDYHCGTSSFVQQARNAAKHKYRLSVKEMDAKEGNGVVIRAYPLGSKRKTEEDDSE